MRIGLVIILLAFSGGAIACEVASRKTPSGELFREMKCEGRLVASERLLLRESKSIATGLCEYILSRLVEGLPGCRPGSDPYCGMSEKSELRTFAFAEKCDWSDSDRTFQLDGDVSTSDLPELISAFNAAKKLVLSPRGMGWTSPMQILSAAELSDITSIGKEGGAWKIHIRLCPRDLSGRECSTIFVSFDRDPASLEDLRAAWVD